MNILIKAILKFYITNQLFWYRFIVYVIFALLFLYNEFFVLDRVDIFW